MVAAIRQQVTVQPGGVIEIRSPELEPGSRAEVIVLIGSDPGPGSHGSADWRRHAGALRSGRSDLSDNEHIDADLAREHADPHEPPA